jgi:hypothetical protein
MTTGANEQLHDRPLGFHWHAPDLSKELGLPALPKALEKVRASILAEAVLADEAGKWVSYSRNKNFYRNGRRYRGTEFSYARVMNIVGALRIDGLIESFIVPPGNLGWQSSFRATPKLMEAWHDTCRELDYHTGEIILLKNASGELIDYTDTRDTLRMRRELSERNEALASLHIELPNVEWRGQHMLIGESYILPIPGNPLHRIFSRGSWSLHGRAYGWWQSIPKTARMTMTINGSPVAEADYSSLHATILYNQAGIRFIGDAYDLDGFERGDVKLGFNIAINAKNKAAAVAALSDRLGKDRKYCANIITALEHRHKPIAHHFCSDAGVRLMRIDSELILGAQRAVNDAGIPPLPIHDALIIPGCHAEATRAKMIEIFEQIVGRVSPCDVKIKRPNDLHVGESFSPPSSPSLLSSSFPLPCPGSLFGGRALQNADGKVTTLKSQPVSGDIPAGGNQQ